MNRLQIFFGLSIMLGLLAISITTMGFLDSQLWASLAIVLGVIIFIQISAKNKKQLKNEKHTRTKIN